MSSPSKKSIPPKKAEWPDTKNGSNKSLKFQFFTKIGINYNTFYVKIDISYKVFSLKWPVPPEKRENVKKPSRKKGKG